MRRGHIWGAILATVALQLVFLSLGQEEEVSLAQQQYEKAMDLRYCHCRPCRLYQRCCYLICTAMFLKISNALRSDIHVPQVKG